MFHDLILITSPPASGKTYWVLRLSTAFGSAQILVISPLRALAEECSRKWPQNITVMTPEEWLGKKTYFDYVVFDEFHLFFYWGDTFRPALWEAFYLISLKAKLTFLLTATLSPEMNSHIKNFETHFDEILWLDFGNRKLKFLPREYIKAPSRAWVIEQIEEEPKGEDIRLVFCEFREEVFNLEERLSKLGYTCVSCVGGESRKMQAKLERCPSPDFIISTTVLSHGVNLPEIKKIYFLYCVANVDFWIQMVARGGRKGEEFSVIGLDKPSSLAWNRWRNFLSVFRLSLRKNFSLRRGLLPP